MHHLKSVHFGTRLRRGQITLSKQILTHKHTIETNSNAQSSMQSKLNIAGIVVVLGMGGGANDMSAACTLSLNVCCSNVDKMSLHG